jgi:hypothetical protein
LHIGISALSAKDYHMTFIKVDRTPVIIKEKSVVEFKVNKIFLTGFYKVANETTSLVPVGQKRWQLTNKRMRIKHQVRAVTETGEELMLDDQDITQIPIVYAGKIDNALNDDDSTPGEIVNSGDGITTPILYRLGTPLKVQANNEASAITELEFFARIFGDIEEVLAETESLGQTVALLRSVAKPLGVNDTLQRLPEWALDRVSLPDAFKIAEEILPRFLE